MSGSSVDVKVNLECSRDAAAIILLSSDKKKNISKYNRQYKQFTKMVKKKVAALEKVDADLYD